VGDELLGKWTYVPTLDNLLQLSDNPGRGSIRGAKREHQISGHPAIPHFCPLGQGPPGRQPVTDRPYYQARQIAFPRRLNIVHTAILHVPLSAEPFYF